MLEVECAVPEDLPKYMLVTFGDGSLGWRNAARRLVIQARASGVISRAICHDRRSIVKILPELASQNFSRNVRGFGYWIWKPYLVDYYMTNSPPGIDGVIYLDAGCSLNMTSAARKRFKTYLELSQKHGGLAFQMDLAEDAWTKEDLLRVLGAGETWRASGQVAATAFFICNEQGRNFTSEWLNLARQPHLLDDSPSKHRNSDKFIEHRHDQSIFSLLAKKHNFKLIPDETAFHPGLNSASSETFINLPIWATRHRSFMNSLSMNPALRGLRFFERLLP